MKKILGKVTVSLGVLIVLGLMVRFGFTVVRIEDVEETAQNEAFNPAAYVDGIWDSELLPTFTEKAVALTSVLSMIQVDENGNIPKEDLIEVTNEYGLITVGEAHVYMVRGSGTIISVNTETSQGTAEVALTGYDGPIRVLLYIGARIPSNNTSVRDSVGFISFGDFKDQTEYGKTASEINQRVLTTVLNDIDSENLVGKTITFLGSFSIPTFNRIQIDVEEIYIVPVVIELGE